MASQSNLLTLILSYHLKFSFLDVKISYHTVMPSDIDNG